MVLVGSPLRQGFHSDPRSVLHLVLHQGPHAEGELEREDVELVGGSDYRIGPSFVHKVAPIVP